MNIGLENITNYIDTFLLVFVRVSTIFVVTPIFGRKSVPNIIKIALSFIISLCMISMLDITIANAYNDIGEFFILVIKEFIVGLILGFITYIAFMSLYLAGELIDMMMGFGMVNVMDPHSNIQIPVVANLFNIITILMFFTFNGHHMLISSILYSYEILPIGSMTLNNVLVDQFIKMFRDMFIVGFTIASPIIGAIFVADIALGILARTMPQMNVFVVGMPLKIIVGISLLIFIIPVFSVVMDNIMGGMYENIEAALQGMGIK